MKFNKSILFYIYTYIFDFVLYFACLNGCVVWKFALCCGPGTDYP